MRTAGERHGNILTASLVLCALVSICVSAVGVRPQNVVPPSNASPFRSEVTPVAGGAELMTIFARQSGEGGDLPLISVLRDTLGDDIPENDRLRYVWLHTYTRPTLKQRLAAAVPFLYTRTNNKIGRAHV